MTEETKQFFRNKGVPIISFGVIASILLLVISFLFNLYSTEQEKQNVDRKEISTKVHKIEVENAVNKSEHQAILEKLRLIHEDVKELKRK